MGVEALPRTIEWVPLDGADGVGGTMVRLVKLLEPMAGLAESPVIGLQL